MSLIININSLSYLYDYLDLGVHDFIVGTNQFSCRQALTVDYIELKEIKENSNYLFDISNISSVCCKRKF